MKDQIKGDSGKFRRYINPPSRRGAICKQVLAAICDYHARKNKAEGEYTAALVRWTRILGWATLCLFAAAVVNNALIWGQLNEMKADQRAWLAPARAELRAFVLQAPLDYVVKFGNTGRDPAFAFVAQQEKGVIDNPRGESWYAVFPQTTLKDICSKTTASNTGQTFFPSGRGEFDYNVTENGFKLSREIISGDKLVFVHGCFAYRTFEKERKSEWCFIFEPGFDPATHNVIAVRSLMCPYGHSAT